MPSGSSAMLSVSSPGVEPGLRPSQGRVLIRHTPRTISLSAPPRNRTPSCRFEDCHAIRHTRRASSVSRPGSNLDLTFGGSVRSAHHRDIQYPDLESNQDQGLRRALCDPLHHRDSTSEPTTGFAPASCGLQNRRLAVRPRRQAGVRGFEPRAAALETASSPRRTLLYRPPALRPGALA